MVRMNAVWARLTLLIASLCIALSSTASAQEPLSTDSLIAATARGIIVSSVYYSVRPRRQMPTRSMDTQQCGCVA
ncbi:hypothetical protein [Porphyromonas uenonis]|uniref:hypothetical protein n=1 Tax=Porphyromonas uenonis TaxID=281920 RepID=UPI001EE2401E|nr:hypothetical protein [Porphyromonas uenonis]